MDYSNITNLIFEGIDYNDYPDFCDIFVTYAERDGVPMSEEEIEELNSYENTDFIHEKLFDWFY